MCILYKKYTLYIRNFVYISIQKIPIYIYIGCNIYSLLTLKCYVISYLQKIFLHENIPKTPTSNTNLRVIVYYVVNY